MANLVAADVTYTLLTARRTGDSRVQNRVRLAFGDGSDTVPAGGIPLTIANLGCPNVVESLVVVDQGTSGYTFQYDQSAEKLVVVQAPAQTHGHDFTITKGAIDTNLEVGLSTDATSATMNNNTISATLALAKATGPVASETLAAAEGAEAAALAIAAQTIEVEVIGW
jgi:hypothetical protein